MTTFVQSGSLQPTARDLLNLLHAMELEDPRSLDKPVGTYDSEYEDYDRWQGKLDIEDDMICLSCCPSKVVEEEHREMRRVAEAERLAHDVELRNRGPVDLSDPVQAAREAGLLPPGA